MFISTRLLAPFSDVAAISSFRSPLGGQSIGRQALLVRFLKGARRSTFSPSLGPRGGVKSSFTATIRAFSIHYYKRATRYCQKYWHPLLMNRFDYFSNFYEYKS